MQIITMYLRASSVKATLVDEWNQTVSVLPALTRGLRAELVLKLVDENIDALDEPALLRAATLVEKTEDKVTLYKKAIEKYEMPWPHMSDLKGWECEAAKPYNVQSIPANVLIDKDGIIVAKNLREQDLLDTLEKYFAE